MQWQGSRLKIIRKHCWQDNHPLASIPGLQAQVACIKDMTEAHLFSYLCQWCFDRSAHPVWHDILFALSQGSEKYRWRVFQGDIFCPSVDDSSLSTELVFIKSSSGLKNVLLVFNTRTDHLMIWQQSYCKRSSVCCNLSLLILSFCIFPTFCSDIYLLCISSLHYVVSLPFPLLPPPESMLCLIFISAANHNNLRASQKIKTISGHYSCKTSSCQWGNTVSGC